MIISVKVIPNSTQDKIEKVGEKSYKAWVSAEPEKGKANSALSKLLSEHFGVVLTDIKIMNSTSRTKKIILKKF